MSSLTTPFNKNHHRFATFVAFCTFLLIIAGALVTSNDAGLAVPDWPTSFGHWPITYGYFKVPMVGGIRWEHGHRIAAQFIGLLTIILAVWTSRVDRRAWMRKLAWAALATVIAQGVLGGLTVRHYLPPSISSAHATLAQTFFCLIVAIWLFTGRTWVEEPRMQLPTKRPSLPWLTTAAAACVYVQLILGASFRHHGIKLLPHIISAAVVTFVLLWTVVRVLSEYSQVLQLRRPALMLLTLLMVQLALGFSAWLTRVQWGRDAPQPGSAMIYATVSHVAVGALLLATTVVLAIQAWRHVAIPTAERIPSHVAKPVAV
jgi:cytochrome c oxidase assembly protein subunit 15